MALSCLDRIVDGNAVEPISTWVVHDDRDRFLVDRFEYGEVLKEPRCHQRVNSAFSSVVSVLATHVQGTRRNVDVVIVELVDIVPSMALGHGNLLLCSGFALHTDRIDLLLMEAYFLL